ncbi:MAG: ATP-dependent DNA helicase [Burkholderiaceae bacterium]|nr:ATP-dependent DNA helicase [Burkholderiaceae bacterium]
MTESSDEKKYLDRVLNIFSEGAELSRATVGFKARPSQVDFALAVAQALVDKRTIVVEAGTGTGKTFAYLVPALLHGGRILISTAGKTLQDQLFYKDIPALIRALGLPVKASVLKGRSNYICPLRLERAMENNVAKSKEEVRYLNEIYKFSLASRTGERADVSTVPENSPIWSEVTSSAENCLGKECEHYDDCFLMKARNRAKSSDLVVVNHHVFMADLSFKDDDMNELLPNFDLVVLDEAHQLPSIAQDFFSETLSLYDVKAVAQDAILSATRKEAQSETDWGQLGKRIVNACDDLRLQMTALGLKEDYRGAVENFRDRYLLTESFEKLSKCIVAMLEAVAPLEDDNDPEFKLIVSNLEEFRLKTSFWAEVFADRINTSENGDSPSVYWFTLSAKNAWFNKTPLSFAKAFKRVREKVGNPWVLTSATLSVQNDFSHFLEQMGADDAQTYRWESPFDYENQALLYIPEEISFPNTAQFSEDVADHIWPLIRLCEGRCFVLCTTLRAVSTISSRLRQKMREEGVTYPLFIQNEMPKKELINSFRKSGNGILVGSMSFWEGVDIKGDALSMVVIDKVPFTPPDDPIFDGKKKWLESQGRSAFRELSLPEATMLLRQGVGRLIRDESDCGLVMICDRRLIDPRCGWGKSIWKALPPFARTKKKESACLFLSENLTKEEVK